MAITVCAGLMIAGGGAAFAADHQADQNPSAADLRRVIDKYWYDMGIPPGSFAAGKAPDLLSYRCNPVGHNPSAGNKLCILKFADGGYPGARFVRGILLSPYVVSGKIKWRWIRT